MTVYPASLGDDGAQLCPLQPWQAEEFLARVDRGREFIGRFNGLPDVVTDVAAARSFLRAYAEKEAADAGRIRAIRLDGTLVGAVILGRFDPAQGTAEAGCRLEPAAVGRGLVTRAARLLIDWAIRERAIHRVEWWVSTGNAPSTAVARRLGMRGEAVLRESHLHRGERHDEEIWSVPAPEWAG